VPWAASLLCRNVLFAATLAIAIPVVDAASLPPWTERRTPHFVIRYVAADEKTASFLLSEAEKIRASVAEDLAGMPPHPVVVYLAPSRADFAAIQPSGTFRTWAVGTAYPESNLIVLLSPRALKGSGTRIEETLRHEFAHLALHRAVQGRRIPHWLNEGFIMLKCRQWTLEWTYVLIRGVLTDSLFSLHELDDGFPSDRFGAQLAYAQSFSAVSFIKEELGSESLTRFIHGLANGLDTDTALRVAAGLRLSEMERAWIRKLKQRYSWTPIVTSVFSVWFLASLLFLIGYWRKRRRAKRLLRQWEREEIFSESSPDSYQ